MRYGIVRPTVLFGGGDARLINNVAWLLRRLPVFAIAGSGAYRIRPVHVDDVALAVAAGRRDDSVVLDAVGPETYTFEELVGLIAATVGRRPVMVHVPPWVALALAAVLGLLVRDVLVTGDELAGLMAELVATTVRRRARFGSVNGLPSTPARSAGVCVRAGPPYR